MHFVTFFSGGFITAIVVNTLESKLEKSPHSPVASQQDYPVPKSHGKVPGQDRTGQDLETLKVPGLFGSKSLKTLLKVPAVK